MYMSMYIRATVFEKIYFIFQQDYLDDLLLWCAFIFISLNTFGSGNNNKFINYTNIVDYAIP